LKSIVLLDRYAVLFQRAELTVVTMPVLIFRPEQSELPGEAHAFALPAELPRKPEFRIIPGCHVMFIDVCLPEQWATSADGCQGPAAADRAAGHREIETQISALFHTHL
jgi:hypothetical protein